jgi:protein associated with RNAse G/E
VRVEYLKWPDRPQYTVEMARLAGDGAVVWGRLHSGDRVVHGNGDVRASTQDSVTLFRRDVWSAARWYRAPSEAGRASRFRCYVDICTPPVIAGGGVRLVDLDLDVALTWDGEIVVLDEDEFAERRDGYPADVVEGALAEAARVARALSERAFPFDGSEERIWTLDP